MARQKRIEATAAAEPETIALGEQPTLEPVEQPTPAEPAQPQTQTYVTVAPVYGAMHHPFQNIRIEGATPVEMDNWIEVQIEAGKLTVQAP